ncbi:nucleoside permease [Orbus sturtevantii]|uniref:nucleoside permease n=1 Tax=Orbus sturtevantii TaxID=3074109 RepID=UPI00370D0C33
MNIETRLKIISFLQFFIWGTWLISFSAYMIKTLGFTSIEVGFVYGNIGIACLFMPSLVGIIADKWVPANYLYFTCHFIGAISLALAGFVTSPTLMILIMLIHCCAFMPSISLSYSIIFYFLAKNQKDPVSYFPKMRVYGTIGLISAMCTISLLKLELSNIQLFIGAAVSLLLMLFITTLPSISIAQKTEKNSMLSILGLNALSLFKQYNMCVFFLFTLFLGAILQINNAFISPFLHDFSDLTQYRATIVVAYPGVLLSLSQVAEIFFIICIPLFLRRYGMKGVLLISLLAWTLRFGFLAYADPSPFGLILFILSMLAYGCAFDFFNVSGSIFIEKSVTADIRNSAQGLFMIVKGFGAYLGAVLGGVIVNIFTVNNTRDWSTIWIIFSSYAFVLFILFLFSFKPNHKKKAA